MKFDFKHCALALGLAALMSACSGGGKPDVDTEWFTCADEDGENFGFFNPGTGKMMFEDEFTSRPTSIVDGVFIVREDENVVVYSAADGKTPKVLGDLDELKEAGGVAEGMLPVVRPNSRIEVYSVSASKAEPAFTLDPIDGKEITLCHAAFSEGLLVIANEDGEYGAVDKNGNVVVSLGYSTVKSANHGILIAGIADDTDDSDTYKWYALNTKGEEIFKFKKGIVPDGEIITDNGYIVCHNKENSRCVLATVKDEYFNMPKDVESIAEFRGEYAVFEKGGNYGVLKVKGEDSEVVVRPKYKMLRLLPWTSGKFLSSKDSEEFAVIDLEGNKTVDFSDDYDYIVPFSTPNWEGFIGWEGNEYVFFGKDGEKIKFSDVHEIYSLGVSTFNDYIVSSDYFNLSEFVRQVSAAISTSGLCGYRMGQYANQYFPDDMMPRNFTSTYWFTPKDEPDVKGYRYSSSIRISAYKRLADWSWDYGSTNYYFISDNPIDGMDLSIVGPSDLWEKAGDKIKDAIEGKGFTVKTEGDSSIQYYTPDGEATLTLSWSSWGSIGLKYYKVY